MGEFLIKYVIKSKERLPNHANPVSRLRSGVQQKHEEDHIMNGSRRWERLLGERAVACLVTSRWLQFPAKSDFVDNGNYMFVDVMTSGDGEKARKICQICISKEALLSALDHVDQTSSAPS